MKFFTSRYTAALEEQVRDLKAEVLRLQQQNNELAYRIMSLPQAAAGLVVPSDKQKDKPEPPRSVNWLRAVRALETPDQIVREAPPEKEKPANGTTR